MNAKHDAIIIIGSGLAGYNLVKEIRKQAADQAVIVITADDGRNYSKPMLSTGFSKNKTADELAMATAADMADQLNIEIRTHTQVTAIDRAKHCVYIGDEALSYKKLVFATGAEVVRPPVAGDAADEIYSINDLMDYSRFRDIASSSKRVLIMGAGLIGCEFAQDMKTGGFDVDVVAPCERPLPELLPAAAGQSLQQGLEDLGVRFHWQTVVNSVQRQDSGFTAHLANGEQLDVDLVISAIGLRPRTSLAATAGLDTNRGIQVNRSLQTNDPDIYALGDCAEVDGHVLLYVLPLMASARALAKTLTGTTTPVSYGVMPVTVKTPSCPVVVSLPPKDSRGEWHIEQDGLATEALYRAENGELLGYALTGSKVTNKVALNKELPAIMP